MYKGLTKKRVIVGMSGGVDSTAAAYLLMLQGHDVSGVTMRIWPGETPGDWAGRGGCYGPGEANDIDSAESACDAMGIPHYVIDLRREYQERVLANYAAEFQSGRTPNPCVRCNQYIKFGFLLEKSRDCGIQFDYFATGHYARITQDGDTGRYHLRKAVDQKKDQSYFLYRLNQDQLRRSLFPLGGFTKQFVRRLARAAGFQRLALKPESQDFLDDANLHQEITAAAPQEGLIVDVAGQRVGKHNGINNFTIGQRKGLGIGGHADPWYVLDIDPLTKRVMVGPREYLQINELSIRNLNWISVEELHQRMPVKARMRSHQHEVACEIFPGKHNEITAVFNKPEIAAAPGQSIVFYFGDTVIGGGIIHAMERVYGNRMSLESEGRN
jgi:tRNA-specific 2-thiouridylase